jgi:hypothetical protein
VYIDRETFRRRRSTTTTVVVVVVFYEPFTAADL